MDSERSGIGIAESRLDPKIFAVSAISLFSIAEGVAKDLNSSVLGIRHIVLALPKEPTTKTIFERLGVDPDEVGKRLQSKIGVIKSDSTVKLDPANLSEPTINFIAFAQEQEKGLCAEKTRAVDFLLTALTSGSDEGKALLGILRDMIPDKNLLIKRIETIGQTIDPEPAGVK